MPYKDKDLNPDPMDPPKGRCVVALMLGSMRGGDRRIPRNLQTKLTHTIVNKYLPHTRWEARTPKSAL